jgi:hypothetical protein
LRVLERHPEGVQGLPGYVWLDMPAKGRSPTIVNRMAQNLANQVSLKTLDAISMALTDVAGKAIGPGDLIERVGRGRGSEHEALNDEGSSYPDVERHEIRPR